MQTLRQLAAYSVLLLAALALSPVLKAQTGTIVGTVQDPTGAVVPKADVQLVNVETNVPASQVTNGSGQYTFVNVAPGTYKITVKATGFRTASVASLLVEVNKSTNQAITLELGSESQVVEVSTSAVAQLQTTDSQIGNVITSDLVSRLPTLQRNVTELMNLQPGVYSTGTGTAGSGANLALRITGAIDDQNTVTVDGIDITQGVVAGNTVVPTPSDSIEELRSSVSNPNASQDRSSGGQMTLVGRRGTNQLHGSGYWYRQDSVLNANTWDNNHAGIAKPAIEDNRYGGRLGGAIVKNKTFIFGNYEGRKFDAVTQVTRTVPTDSLKQGIFKFVDGTGSVQSINIATASICGPSGNSPCDPRGLGLSPTVKASWALMPAGNVAGGDGLNTTGYLANIGTPIDDQYGVARIDHIFSDKFTFNGNYTYFRRIQVGSGDVSIANGNAQSVISTPTRGSVTSAGLTWTIKPTLINVTHFGYVHDTNANQATSPTQAAGILNLPGTSTAAGPIAALIGSGVSSFIDSPIDMDTQRARFQANYNGSWQYINDTTWIKGSHSMQMGAQLLKLPYTHVRADKVVGSLSSLAATVDGNGANISIPTADQPLTCGGSVTTNCLKASDLSNWNRYYASALGLVDNVNILAIRDASLKPVPFGTNLINQTNQYATYFYFQDSWRVTNSLTLNLGLAYGFQTPPVDVQGRQTIMIDSGSGQQLNASDYMSSRLQGALQGNIYNPSLGWVPVQTAGKNVFSIDYKDWAPRASFAWNPGKDSKLGWLMGDKKSVIRGGFAMVYDRTNSVQSVLIPMLGVGFAQTITVNGPKCNATGAGGGACNASSTNPALSAFRLGVDGTLPLPPFGSATSPVIPSAPYGETLSFMDDPKNKVARSYNIDLSLQRELSGGIVIDAAFVGRYARALPEAVNFTNSPYMFVDPKSGQSFAQAFDSVATTLRAGGAVTATQPWFEDLFPGLATAQKAASATAYIVSANKNNFINGNVTNLFQQMGAYRRSLGLTPFVNDQSITEFMRTYIGQSNYNGMLLTLAKRPSKGFQFSVNYTLSKAMDDGISNQNSAGFYTNSFHPGVDYGPSSFDRKNVFNANFLLDLPLGRSHRIHGNKLVDSVIGGWYTSGIFQAMSGQPLFVTESSQVWGDDSLLGSNTGAIPMAQLSTGVVKNVAAVGGIGTAGNGASGTGLNLFGDPTSAFNSFRPVLLATDTRTGRANPLRGPGLWNYDESVGKDTHITERVTGRISFDFFNLFNHTNFRSPALSLQSPATFGVITAAFIPANRTNSARWIQIGLRLSF